MAPLRVPTMPAVDGDTASAHAATPVPRPSQLGHWVGWRWRGLVALTLAACLTIFGWMRSLAEAPHLPLQLKTNTAGQLILQAGPVAPLAAHVGQVLRALSAADGQGIELSALALALAPRWTPGDDHRQALLRLHQGLARAATQGALTLTWGDGRVTTVAMAPRGLVGLGGWPWPLAALALLVVLVGGVVALSRPHAGSLLYLLICVCQAASLLFLAGAMAQGLGLPAWMVAADMPTRATLDLISAGAAVHALALYPQRLRQARWLASLAWAAVAVLVTLLISERLVQPWWAVQAALLLAAMAAVGITRVALPNPVLVTVGRLALSAMVAVVVMSVGALAAPGVARLPMPWMGTTASTLVFVGNLWLIALLLAPFLMRSREAMREFVLLASVSTVAASLDVLFINVFSLAPFASLTLVVFIALGLYAAARQWLFDRLLASHALTTERIFEQLYRAAREVQAHPERHAQQLAVLLRELFEPLEVQRHAQPVAHSQVAGGGALLLVPVLAPSGPGLEAAPAQARNALLLRFARRGQRLFTREDARLADRVVEQLRRAVAYDLAVERGRSEERQRIAQDLHDDIGARLLTLMYQAPNPEMEDYVRHTLKDLKTLTRGLAAGEHVLSHAVAEWKTDLAQRVAAAGIDLDWSARFDQDLRLSMVQWSAITRVLRELVSNALHHGHASKVTVRLSLLQQELRLSVADDGVGGDPQAWAHGLGLGGVRKRIKLLGGDVIWRQGEPRGIVCEVRVSGFAIKPAALE